jgi:site-specific DNA recombinase
MGPSHAAKGGRRWRYYVSRALLKGRKQDAGSITRVPAAEIEKQVLAAVRSAGSFHDRPIKMSTAASVVALSAEGKLIEPRLDGANYDRLHDAIERVTVRKREIEIRLNDTLVADGQSRTLFIPWKPPPPYRRREIIQGEDEPSRRFDRCGSRRGVVLAALRNAHRWLDQLMSDPDQTIESLAAREGKSERSIRMTLSLAFVAHPSSPRRSRGVCRAGSALNA